MLAFGKPVLSHGDSSYNRGMIFAKRLFALLSVVLCLSLFAQQTERSFAVDFDSPTFTHVQQIEMDNDREVSEPILAMRVPLLRPVFVFDLKLALPIESYLPPDLFLITRPPIA